MKRKDIKKKKENIGTIVEHPFHLKKEHDFNLE